MPQSADRNYVIVPKFVSHSHLMIFSVELAVLQRENQRHEDRHSDFFTCAEWFGS